MSLSRLFFDFVHTSRGHAIFAHGINGKEIFFNERSPNAYYVEGVNYFDMERAQYIHNGMAVFFGDGDHVTFLAEGEPVRFLLISIERG